MGLTSNSGKSYKGYIYSFVTILIIGVLTFGYLSFIVPKNEQKEDAKNRTILKSIENQLNAYLDDQIKYINEDGENSIEYKKLKESDNNYIDTIKVNNNKTIELKEGIISVPRIIKFLDGKSETHSIEDTVSIDLAKFITKISPSTPFTSFYICPIEYKECETKKLILSKDVPVADQDNLIQHNREKSPFSFENSSKRYYTDHLYIPQTRHTLFLAVGIDQSTFQNNVNQIETNLLIFSLMLTIILILGINFIKPIISSHKEILSQTDLIGVVLSSGILLAVLVVFITLLYWNNSIKIRNENDLKELVNKIDISFNDQIKTYKRWRVTTFREIGKDPKKQFAKLILKNGSTITSLNGEALTDKENQLDNNKKYEISDCSFFNKMSKKSKLIKYLDCYFRMDNKGLMKSNFIKNIPEIPRKFADRNYFKILQQSYNKNEKTKSVLTAVFSREDNEYQLILAQKSSESKNTDITGIAFREYLSDELELPPGTGYMFVDRKGSVIMQNNPEKNLYQNLLNDSQNNANLISLLSGKTPLSFQMEYQGTSYQVYAKKLSLDIDSPVYVLGLRDMKYIDRLALFSFSNGFLISVLFGFLMLCLSYSYSVFFYRGRINILSMHHFYHLFPDNSRTAEYKILLITSIVSILLALTIFYSRTPSLGSVFYIILAINIVLINFITLSIRVPNPTREIFKLIFFLCPLGIFLPFILFFEVNKFLAVIVLFSIHLGVLYHYKGWRKGKNLNLEMLAKNNKGVNRKAYTKFFTVRLLYQFVLFPYILISSFYVTELNDFTSYYCSFLDSKNAKVTNKDPFITLNKDRVTNAYSCNCLANTDKSNNSEKEKIENFQNQNFLQKANFGFLDRPSSYETNNFTFDELNSYNYFSSYNIFPNKDNLFYFILTPFSLLLIFLFLAVLAYQLLNFYSNRFFFYDLMQAGYEKYYPFKKYKFSTQQIIIPMMKIDEIKNLIESHAEKEIETEDTDDDILNCSKEKINTQEVFDKDKEYEISHSQRINFILNYNNKEFAEEFFEIWESLPNKETKYVLFDFAQDNFANYKNKDIIRYLMERGIIDCSKLTGRLKLMSPSFRLFILYKTKTDLDFVEDFKKENKDGTFSRLKFPLLLIAIGALTLLFYLSKDSYDNVTLVGTSVVTVITFISKFIEANKGL